MLPNWQIVTLSSNTTFVPRADHPGGLLYGVIYPGFTSYVPRCNKTSTGRWQTILSVLLKWHLSNADIGVSVFTVILCALVGVPLAFLFERYSFPGRNVFATLMALLIAAAMVGTVAHFLFGESGILARAVNTPLFSARTVVLRGWPALFSFYTMYPFFYVLAGAGLRRIDGLAETGRSLGAKPLRVLLHRPATAMPSLIAAGLLTFMTSMASFVRRSFSAVMYAC